MCRVNLTIFNPLFSQLVYHTSHAVRVECLNLIGQLSHTASRHEALLALVMAFCSDSDCRVRQAAATALVGVVGLGGYHEYT